MFLKVMKMFNL